MRKPSTKENWQSEADYCESVPAHAPGAAYCHDPAIFEKYCQMQARFALDDGAHVSSARIAKCAAEAGAAAIRRGSKTP